MNLDAKVKIEESENTPYEGSRSIFASVQQPLEDAGPSETVYEQNKYATFPSSVRAQQALYQKQLADRSAENERRRKEKEKQKRKVEQWKANRVHQTVSNFQDDSDSDGAPSASVDVIMLSDSDGEADEVLIDETVTPKSQNALQKSRVKDDPSTKVKLEPSDQEEISRRRRDSSSEKKRKKKKGKYRTESSSSEDDDRNNGRDVRKAKKRRHSLSSKSSESDRDRRSRKSKASKHKHSSKKKGSRRRYSPSESSSSSDERSKKKKFKAAKWNFLPTGVYDLSTKAGLDQAYIFAKQKDVELFQHSHVYKSERTEWNPRIAYIALGPESSEQKQLYEQLAKAHLNTDKAHKVKTKRLHDRRLKWTKNPENYFATKAGKIANYIEISSLRLDRPELMYQAIDPKVLKDAPKEVSTEILISELKDGTFEEIVSQLKNINEDINRLSAAKGTAADRENLERLWMIKFELEEKEYNLRKLQMVENEEITLTPQQFMEIKEEKIKKASNDLPFSFPIFKEALAIHKERLPPDEVQKLLEKKIAVFGSDPKFWNLWIDMMLHDMRFYRFEKIEEVFIKAVQVLHGLITKKYNLSRDLTGVQEKQVAIIQLIQKRLSHLMDTGRVYKGIAHCQALLEYRCAPDNLQKFLNSGDESKKALIDESFMRYWDSGAAKVGDKNSITWKNYNGSDYPEPELKVETESRINEEIKKVSEYIGTYQDENLLITKLWVALEKLRENYYWRPIRTFPEELAADETDRLVRWEDLKLPPSSEQYLGNLISNLPSLLGARRPFEKSLTTSNIASRFGGFNVKWGLSSGLESFLENVSEDILQGKLRVVPLIAEQYIGARSLKLFDNYAADASIEKKDAMKRLLDSIIRMISNMGHEVNNPFLHAYPFALIIQEATSWFHKTESLEEKMLFTGIISTIFNKLYIQYAPFKGDFLDIEDPKTFSLHMTLIYSLMKVFNSPTITTWILVSLANGKLPKLDDKIALRETYYGRRLAGTEVVQAIDKWKSKEEAFLKKNDVKELMNLGIYQPSTLFCLAYMHLVYNSGQGASTQRFIKAQEAFKRLVVNSPFDGAFICSELADLVKTHDSMYHNCSNVYLELLKDGLRRYPTDTVLRKMECDAHVTRPFFDRTNYAEQLRIEHENAKDKQQLSNILAITRVYFARRIYENIMIPLEESDASIPILNMVIQEYKAVAEMENDPFIWCLLIKLYVERRAFAKAFEAYIQGTKQCVWSRSFHLFWAQFATPEQVNAIQQLMVQKDIPMLIEDTVIETYIEAHHHGTLNANPE